MLSLSKPQKGYPRNKRRQLQCKTTHVSFLSLSPGKMGQRDPEVRGVTAQRDRERRFAAGTLGPPRWGADAPWTRQCSSSQVFFLLHPCHVIHVGNISTDMCPMWRVHVGVILPWIGTGIPQEAASHFTLCFLRVVRTSNGLFHVGSCLRVFSPSRHKQIQARTQCPKLF